jgi:hypothetical protein
MKRYELTEDLLTGLTDIDEDRVLPVSLREKS